MGRWTASAPGKLILSGEHAVVYGYRAVAAAVSMTTEVELFDRPGPSSIAESRIHDDRLWSALSLVVPTDGVGIRIRSTLPTGCGMGSSAALAVATVRAVARRTGREATPEECFEGAWAMESVFHGTPSGVDQAVSARGGVVTYRKSPPELETLRLARPVRLVVVNSGPPAWSTAEMVRGVRERAPTAALAAIGAVTERVIAALARGEDIGPLCSENHALLREIGVSTETLDTGCAALVAAGASGAKLAGAGGGGVFFGVVTAETETAVRRAGEVFGEVFGVEVGAADV